MGLYQEFSGKSSYAAISAATTSSIYETGVVTEKTAVQIPAIFCAVRIISEGVAALPITIYEPKKKGGKKKAKNHPLFKLLRYAPNSWQTIFEFIQYMVLTALLNGNAYAKISRINGEITEIVPLEHDCVTVKRNPDRTVYYEFRSVIGKIIYEKEQVFHLSGLSMDGLKGINVVKTAMKTFSLIKGLEKVQNHLNDSNLRLDALLSSNSTVTAEQAKRLSGSFQTQYNEGGEGGISVLDGQDWTIHPITMTAKDAQQIENRDFAISEVARVFGIFPILLMKSGDTSTFASSQEFFLQHVKITLMPWILRLEQRIKLDLLGIDNDFYVKFNVSALLAGDAKARAEFYRSGIESGYLTRNEARALEDRNPIEGLDDPVMPLNFEAVKGKKKKKKKKKRKNKEKSVEKKELEHVS